MLPQNYSPDCNQPDRPLVYYMYHGRSTSITKNKDRSVFIHHKYIPERARGNKTGDDAMTTLLLDLSCQINKSDRYTSRLCNVMLDLTLVVTTGHPIPRRGACGRVLRILKSEERAISGPVILETDMLCVTTGPQASSTHQSGN